MRTITFLFFIVAMISLISSADVVDGDDGVYWVQGESKELLLESSGDIETGVKTYSIESVTQDEKWALIMGSETAAGARVYQYIFLYNIENKAIPEGYENIGFGSEFQFDDGVSILKIGFTNKKINLSSIKLKSTSTSNLTKKIPCEIQYEASILCEFENINSIKRIKVGSHIKKIDFTTDYLYLYPSLVEYGRDRGVGSYYDVYYWDLKNDSVASLAYNKKNGKRLAEFTFDVHSMSFSTSGVIFREIASNTYVANKDSFNSFGLTINGDKNIRIYCISDSAKTTMLILNKENWDSAYFKEIDLGIFVADFHGKNYKIFYKDSEISKVLVDDEHAEYEEVGKNFMQF